MRGNVDMDEIPPAIVAAARMAERPKWWLDVVHPMWEGIRKRLIQHHYDLRVQEAAGAGKKDGDENRTFSEIVGGLGALGIVEITFVFLSAPDRYIISIDERDYPPIDLSRFSLNIVFTRHDLQTSSEKTFIETFTGRQLVADNHWEFKCAGKKIVQFVLTYEDDE